jgi:hypothetical protein
MIEFEPASGALFENRASTTNRWGIAAAGFLMQMALGAVYA